jgi:hypothetical protein
MTWRSWDGVEPREPSRINFSVNGYGWTVTLTDYQLAQKLQVRVPHFLQWMDVVEEALTEGKGDWQELTEGKGAQKLKAERRKLLDAKDDD